MRCILLAAGYATRLYPLTKDTPKPLLKVAGKPILEHILSRVEKIDAIQEITIVTNDKFHARFLEWKKDYASNKKIEILSDGTKSNNDRLGAIGDIHFVLKAKNIDEDVLVIGGDNLFEFSLARLAQFFKEKGKSVVALVDVKNRELAKNYGIVGLDTKQRIVAFWEKPEKPESTLASTACYLFSKEDIEELERCIQEHHQPDNLGDFIKFLSEKKPVYGFVFAERWFDIGDHQQLKEADSVWGQK